MKTFKLENEPKIELGFKVPHHYFENFSSHTLEPGIKVEPKAISVFKNTKKMIVLVAAIFVISIMIPFFYNWSKNTKGLKSLDSATLENYLTDPSNMSQYELISGLQKQDIDKIKISTTQEEKAIENHSLYQYNLENFILE